MKQSTSACNPLLLIVFISVFVPVAFGLDICTEKVGVLDGPLISRHSWQVVVPSSESSGARDTFYLSLCQPLSFPAGSVAIGCNGAMVCRVRTNETTVYVSAERNASTVTSYQQWLFVTGPNCREYGQYKIAIRSSCGIHLGSPEFYTESHTACQVHFLWRTSAACDAPPKRSEVPCYAYDSRGSKYDLSPLILRMGSHRVESLDEDVDLRINVCSDMAPGAKDSLEYSSESGACLVRGGNRCVSVGQLDTGLQWVRGSLTLTYGMNSTLQFRPSCTRTPRTVVVFKCPGRGESYPPRLISSWNCQYRVEWETQYACPLDLLTGDVATCKFVNSTHGQDLDLSPLVSLEGHHNSTVEVDGKEATVLYNVCGKGLDAEGSCGRSKGYNTAVCLVLNSTHTLSLGDVREPTFQLIDGVASMTFHDGSLCANNRTWSSRIDFVCEKKLRGLGRFELTWVDEEYCRYHFAWDTEHACPKKSTSVCAVQEGNIRVDISPLAVGKGQEPWTALGNRNTDRNETFYLSLCGDGSRPAQKCDSQTAVCFVDGAGEAVSYGRVSSFPAYNTKTQVVSVTVSGGDQCKPGSTYSSVVYLICKPGTTTTSPVFLGTDESGCLAEFEWHTASACPLKAVAGTGCRIEDKELGFTLDLSPLTSSVPYKMESAEYRYYLNVCGGLGNTPCKGVDAHSSPAVCQESKANSHWWVLGAGEPLLHYLDGMVNLTYVNGTPYNDPNRTPRSTSIAFLCDHEAGIGAPQFAEERDRTYSFLWYTSYACPSSYYTSCVHRDPATGLHYDLSRLSQLHEYRDWVVEDLERGGRLRFYLNLCRPLRQPPNGCSSRTAACVVRELANGTEVVEVADAGKARNLPTFEDGTLTLLYDLGQECAQYGRKVNYSVSIHFLCDPKQPEALMLMKKVGNCRYVFVWVTHAACPVSHLQARGSCTLTDPRTSAVYDLSPLMLPDSYYSLTNWSELYEVNICGPVHGGHCTSMANVSVCKVENGTGVPLGLSDNAFLSLDEEGSMQLAYVGSSDGHSGDASKVLIEVSCSRDVEGLSLVQSATALRSLVLNLETVLACPPEDTLGATGCSFTAGRERYDLSPLAKRLWRVQATPMSRKLLLSFCSPLGATDLQAARCPASASACELDPHHNEVPGTSLGSFTSPPRVAADGSVVIRYRNGGPCGNGTARRSMVVTLLCDETEEPPMFVGESPECNLLFTMKTPAACPLKVSTGDDCKVMDPRYGYLFDFSGLANSTEDYAVRTREYTYLINVCRPLVSANGTCEGAAACQTKPADHDFHVGAGRPSSTVTYHNGRISLNYTDGQGPCRGRYNRSTVLQFLCDHTTDGRHGGPMFVDEDSECTYLFEWRTRFACPPVVEAGCTVSLNGSHVVDLSPLSNPRENYEVRTHSGTKVVLNVCRSVIYQPGSVCEHNAGACAMSRPHVTENLGTVKEPPYVEDRVVKLRYSSGDACQTAEGQVTSMETVIQFLCDHRAQAGRPEFLTQDKCKYSLRWRTVYACPMAQDSVHDQCSAVHPLTGETLDLSPLKKATPYTVPYGGGSPMAYQLSICGPLEGKICGPGAGACLAGGTVGVRYNLGLANGRLHFRDGVMFLNYSRGDVCPLGGRRSTLVQFACASAGYSHLGPQLVHVQNDCTYYFVWHTELVCRKVVHCFVKEGEDQFDLSPLILSTGRYTALNVDRPGFVYYINVCRPLNPVRPYHMLPNAGIVRVSDDGSTVESLGEVPMEPFNDFEGHVSLLYVNGSPCAGNSTARNRARIIFICDPSTTVEQPILMDVDGVNCLYLFVWRTNLVCPRLPGLPDGTREGCSFAVPEHGLHFDLAELHGGRNGSSSLVFEVSVPGGEGKFLLDVCGRLSTVGCEGSSVCFLSPNHQDDYGVLASATYYHDSLRVRYVNGSACTSSEAPSRSAEINFECSPSAGTGAPVLEKRYACHSTFRWPTNLVCLSEHKECTATSGNDLYDFGLLSSISSPWNVTDGQGNNYWLNVCQGMMADHEGQQGCPDSAAICLSTPSGQHYTVGKLLSQRITVTRPGEVHFTYGGGDPAACPGGDRYPKTRITFRCPPGGGAVGAPEFVHGPTEEECLFVFGWESRMACPQQEGIVLPENNGMIVDTKSNFAMNFSKILNGTFKATEKRGSDKYVYVVQLGQSVQTMVASDKCSLAGVCQTKLSTGFHRDVGSYTTRKFVLKGSELLLEMKSVSSVCGRTSEEVTSIISFFCSSEAGLGQPEFLFESGKCHYVFSWPTAYMCPSSLTSVGNKDTQEVPAGGSAVSAASTGGSVVTTVVIAVCCMLIVFAIVALLMKRDRRDAIKSKIQRAFGRVTVPQYRYTKTTSRLQAVREGDMVLLTSAASVNSIDDSGDVDPLG